MTSDLIAAMTKGSSVELRGIDVNDIDSPQLGRKLIKRNSAALRGLYKYLRMRYVYHDNSKFTLHEDGIVVSIYAGPSLIIDATGYTKSDLLGTWFDDQNVYDKLAAHRAVDKCVKAKVLRHEKS